MQNIINNDIFIEAISIWLSIIKKLRKMKKIFL